MNEIKRSRLDFHIHTTISDGQNTVDEILEMAYADITDGKALKAICLSDHNRIAMPEKKVIGEGEEIMIVHPACEFSTTYYVPRLNEKKEIHVIGLWENSVDPEKFSDIFSKCFEGKAEYIQAILNKLATLDIHITNNELQEEAKKANGPLGRNHICNILIRRGFAKDVNEAMDKWVGNYSPYVINPAKFMSYCPIAEVVERILETNGCPILCHPFGYALELDEIEALIRTFAEVVNGRGGGLEVFYERYLPETERMHFLKTMAKKYQLVESVASDRHRYGQPFASSGDENQYQKILKLLRK